MGIVVVILLAILLATYGDLCADASRRDVEYADLRTKIAKLDQRLIEVEHLSRKGISQ